MYIPNQGDIVQLSFDPSTGKEITKRRPAFVISKRIFNEHTGFTVVAPITSTIRHMRLEVVLPVSLVTTGSVLVHQLKSLDFEEREVALIETAPTDVIQRVLRLTRAIVS